MNVLLLTKVFELESTTIFMAIGLFLLFGMVLGLSSQRNQYHQDPNYYGGGGYRPDYYTGTRGSPGGSMGFVFVVTLALFVIVMGFAFLENPEDQSKAEDLNQTERHYKKQLHDDEDTTLVNQSEYDETRTNVKPGNDQKLLPKQVVPDQKPPSDTQFVSYNEDTSYKYVYTVQYVANSNAEYAENTLLKLEKKLPGIRVWLNYNETDHLTRVCINAYRNKEQAREIAAQLSRTLHQKCLVYELIMAS